MGKSLAATWKPIVDGKVHTVEVMFDSWSSSGEILVNGKIADAWGARFFPVGTRKFEVAGKPAILKNRLGWGDLIVDGKKVHQEVGAEVEWLREQNKALLIIVMFAAFAVFPLAIWFFSPEDRIWAIVTGIVFSVMAVIFAIGIIIRPQGKK